MNSMVKHVNYTEQGMIVLQDKLIELDNKRAKQPICMYQNIWETISTKKTPQTSLPYKKCTRKSKQAS